jgi:hypothetical protein
MEAVKPRPVAFRRLLVPHGDGVDENAGRSISGRSSSISERADRSAAVARPLLSAFPRSATEGDLSEKGTANE